MLTFSRYRRLVRCDGLWFGVFGHSHIFPPSIPQEWDDRVNHRAGVVGKYCVYGDGGWTLVAVQVIARGQHIRVSFSCLVRDVTTEQCVGRWCGKAGNCEYIRETCIYIREYLLFTISLAES